MRKIFEANIPHVKKKRSSCETISWLLHYSRIQVFRDAGFQIKSRLPFRVTNSEYQLVVQADCTCYLLNKAGAPTSQATAARGQITTFSLKSTLST